MNLYTPTYGPSTRANGQREIILEKSGEGPWLPDRERRRMMHAAVRTAGGRLKIAAQVSDNSVPRILDNAAMAAEAGVDFAIIAPPATLLNATPDRVTALFVEAASRCQIGRAHV